MEASSRKIEHYGESRATGRLACSPVTKKAATVEVAKKKAENLNDASLTPRWRCSTQHSAPWRTYSNIQSQTMHYTTVSEPTCSSMRQPKHGRWRSRKVLCRAWWMAAYGVRTATMGSKTYLPDPIKQSEATGRVSPQHSPKSESKWRDRSHKVRQSNFFLPSPASYLYTWTKLDPS